MNIDELLRAIDNDDADAFLLALNCTTFPEHLSRLSESLHGPHPRFINPCDDEEECNLMLMLYAHHAFNCLNKCLSMLGRIGFNTLKPVYSDADEIINYANKSTTSLDFIFEDGPLFSSDTSGISTLEESDGGLSYVNRLKTLSHSEWKGLTSHVLQVYQCPLLYTLPVHVFNKITDIAAYSGNPSFLEGLLPEGKNPCGLTQHNALILGAALKTNNENLVKKIINSCIDKVTIGVAHTKNRRNATEDKGSVIDAYYFYCSAQEKLLELFSPVKDKHKADISDDEFLSNANKSLNYAIDRVKEQSPNRDLCQINIDYIELVSLFSLGPRFMTTVDKAVRGDLDKNNFHSETEAVDNITSKIFSHVIDNKSEVNIFAEKIRSIANYLCNNNGYQLNITNQRIIYLLSLLKNEIVLIRRLFEERKSNTILAMAFNEPVSSEIIFEAISGSNNIHLSEPSCDFSFLGIMTTSQYKIHGASIRKLINNTAIIEISERPEDFPFLCLSKDSINMAGSLIQHISHFGFKAISPFMTKAAWELIIPLLSFQEVAECALYVDPMHADLFSKHMKSILGN